MVLFKVKKVNMIDVSLVSSNTHRRQGVLDIPGRLFVA
nr:MAG TPA_asm: hypothetical protein [Caudoviricetes sp.]